MSDLNFTPFPNITTSRLTLRQLNANDFEEIFFLRSNEQVNKHLDRPRAASIQDAKAFINQINTSIQNNKGLYWAIAFKNNSKLIGTICYYNISGENSSAEIGYELMPACQGKGIMQEAFSKIIQFGFETLKVEKIIAMPTKENHKSIRLLQKNNFELDIHFENENKIDDGSSYSQYFLTLQQYQTFQAPRAEE